MKYKKKIKYSIKMKTLLLTLFIANALFWGLFPKSHSISWEIFPDSGLTWRSNHLFVGFAP